MAETKPTIDIKQVKRRIENYTGQDIDVVFKAFYIFGKQKNTLVNNGKPQQLNLVTKGLKYENPDKVRIELYNADDLNDLLWFTEYKLKKNETETISPDTPRGLGEAEITELVERKFAEKQRVQEHEELKTLAKELSTENEQLQNQVENLEEKNAELKAALENKKEIRYYAGMLGDILESFGISKERIRKPIAELMGITDKDTNDETRKLSAKEDNSGIVEEQSNAANENEKTETTLLTPEEQKRIEIIGLIAEYLKTTSNPILAKIFSIFSEIEAKNAVADELLEYINKRKEFSNDNI